MLARKAWNTEAVPVSIVVVLCKGKDGKGKGYIKVCAEVNFNKPRKLVYLAADCLNKDKGHGKDEGLATLTTLIRGTTLSESAT